MSESVIYSMTALLADSRHQVDISLSPASAAVWLSGSTSVSWLPANGLLASLSQLREYSKWNTAQGIQPNQYSPRNTALGIQY